MNDLDYEALIKEKCADLELVTGKVLKDALVNIVDPEINVVYLQIGNSWFVIQGEVGSEILGIHQIDNDVVENDEEWNWIGRIPLLSQFVGFVITRARQIGEAWNGHGFEFSFKDLPEKTLILQSIYTGSEPATFHDCMRIGVGNYVHSIPILDT